MASPSAHPNSLPYPSPSTAYISPHPHLSLWLFRLLSKPRLRGSVRPSMRFLLDFASCCGCAPPATSSSHPHYGEKRRSFGARRPTSRLPPSDRPCHVMKRRRLAGSAQWTPTLVPISEDDDDDEVATGSEKQGKRRSDASNALHYDYDYKRAGGGCKIITGFYPMPYMF